MTRDARTTNASADERATSTQQGAQGAFTPRTVFLKGHFHDMAEAGWRTDPATGKVISPADASTHNPLSRLSDEELDAQCEQARKLAHDAPREMVSEVTGGFSLRSGGGTFAIRSREYFALLAEKQRRARATPEKE